MTDTTTQNAGVTISPALIATAAEQVLGIVGTVLTALVPGGQIAGVAVGEIIALANGVLNGVPEVVDAYNAVKAAVDGGAAPTADQLAALKASVDAADDVLQADAAADPKQE